MSAVLIDAGPPWYSSEVLWSVVGVMVALGVGILTLLITWVPRQRLYYWALSPTPLLTSGTRSIAELEIRHEGRQLADPHLLEVILTTRGRRDIPSSAFDQGRPLVFSLDTRIVKVLQVRVQPSSSLSPPVAHDGSTLRVGPELIGFRQTITISVLLDGYSSRLVCTQPVLTQVTVIQQKPPDRSSAEAPSTRLVLVTAAAILGATVPGLVGAGPTSTLIGAILAGLLASFFITAAFSESKGRPKRTIVTTALLLTFTSVVLTVGGFSLADYFVGQTVRADRLYTFPPPLTPGTGVLQLRDGSWGDVELQVVSDKTLATDFGYLRQDGKRVFAATSGGKVAPVSEMSQPDMTKCRETLGNSSESIYELDSHPSGSWLCAMTGNGLIVALQIFFDQSGEDRITVIYIVWNS